MRDNLNVEDETASGRLARRCCCVARGSRLATAMRGISATSETPFPKRASQADRIYRGCLPSALNFKGFWILSCIISLQRDNIVWIGASRSSF